MKWYEAGDIEEVGRHRLGSGAKRREVWTWEQERRVGEAVSEGRFRTIGEAMAWCEKELGVAVSYKKLHYWFRRWGYRKKVPRPMAEEADVQAQEGWKKGGLLAALQAEGLRRGEAVVFADEMRPGLLRQVRRVWGRRGEKMRQRVELRYEWVYLVLGVDPMKGRLWWDWVKRVRGVEIAQVLRAWKGAGVWYGTMRPCTRQRWWGRWGATGLSAALFA